MTTRQNDLSMPQATCTALIADIDAFFRLAISGLLTHKLGYSEVVEVSSFGEAREYFSEHSQISIALLNLSTPGMGGTAGLRALREGFPETKIAVTSASRSRRNILAALESGVHGYLPKNLGIPELAAALRFILDGGIYVPSSLAELETSSNVVTARSPLTPRQRDVLELLVQGKPNKEIASALKLSEGTVKVHMAAIFRRFGVNNRAAAVMACTRYNSGLRPPSASRAPRDDVSIAADYE
jgi:DNA-binding NarL/FixJ family response regulator